MWRGHVPAGEYYVGDDAAVLKPFVGEAIISTDVAVLGIHLDAELFSLRDLGYKAVDQRAVGSRRHGRSAPRGGARRQRAARNRLEEIHVGAAEAALAKDTAIVGGDLSGGTRRHRRGDGLWRVPGARCGAAQWSASGDELLVTGRWVERPRDFAVAERART